VNFAKIAKNWNRYTREQAITSVVSFTRTNLFVLKCNPAWIDALLEILLTLLQDEVIELRESAHNWLSWFVGWEIINREALVEQFKSQATDGSNTLVVRHGAILGLCAFLSAYPATFPDYIPDILLFLCDQLHKQQHIIMVNIQWC